MPHVFLTGAASGLGRHLALAFSRRGWRLSAADLDASRLRVVSRQDGWGHRAHCHPLDVRDPAAWRSVWAAAEAAEGPIDILINNAGVLTPGWIDAVDDAAVDTHLDVNVKGVIHGTRVAAAAMKARGAGHIINVASLAGLSPVPGLSLYAASKFAVRGLSLSVAAELAGSGVAVSCLLPDAIATPMLDLQAGRPEAELTFSGGRVLRPAEVEAAIDQLLASRALELAIPAERGILARLAGLAPGLSLRLTPLFRRLGRRGQARYRA